MPSYPSGRPAMFLPVSRRRDSPSRLSAVADLLAVTSHSQSQDVHRRVDVSVHPETAVHTMKVVSAPGVPVDGTTARSRLRRLSRVDFDQPASVPLRLVGQLLTHQLPGLLLDAPVEAGLCSYVLARILDGAVTCPQSEAERSYWIPRW